MTWQLVEVMTDCISANTRLRPEPARLAKLWRMPGFRATSRKTNRTDKRSVGAVFLGAKFKLSEPKTAVSPIIPWRKATPRMSACSGLI